MKWIALISLVILLSFTESRNFQKRDTDDDHHKTAGELFKSLDKDKFQAGAIMMLAHYIPQSSCHDIDHIARDITAKAEACATNEHEEDCQKHAVTTMLDAVCRHSDQAGMNEGFTDCCSKQDPERNTCFKSHKITDSKLLPPYVRPDPQEVCKNLEEHKIDTLQNYGCELAKRYPSLQSPFVLYATHQWEDLLNRCCKEPNIAECIKEKKPDLLKEIKTVEAYQAYNCEILRKFEERVFQASKLAHACRKYPSAASDILIKLSGDITHLHKECCSGDMLECMLERKDVTDYTCSNQEKISSNLKECCDKPIGEKGDCIIKKEDDEKPEGLAAKVLEYIQDPKMCQQFEQEKDIHLAKFECAFAKDRRDLSVQQVLIVASNYEQFLKNCCPQENAVECLSKAETQLNERIAAAKAVLKHSCEQLHKSGPYIFQNALIRAYTVKMPLVRAEEIVDLTQKMVNVAEKCCEDPEEKQMFCSDTGLSMVINELCKRHEKVPISDRVTQCCDLSYSGRSRCFIEMKPDESYVPPPLTPDMFSFHKDLCTVSEKEQQEKKQVLLVHLLQNKPTMTDSQFQEVSQLFLTMVNDCCKDGSPEECFTTQGPVLIKKCEALFTT
ncbi:serum albumin-like [Rhinatrema bivittatum]|uniref:serum albumin-like n=1 Tax=Rhinatrema bivittatum TaxID=194408 RepID=UPI001127BF7C|nr:serum albumin-like [Rhinatrema bivittatum]